uniref:DNA-binding protein inhibitor ID-4 n=1 Tax=Macaca fascicularis TaxID=9541 RepID=A0A7N9CN91_MACFA
AEIPSQNPELLSRQLGSGASRCPERAGRRGKGSGAGRGRGPELACLPRSPRRVRSRRAQGARDEGGEPGAPLGPQGAVGLRRWGAGAALPGRARPQPGGSAAAAAAAAAARCKAAEAAADEPALCLQCDMNDCYSRLRRLVPTIPPNKKVSKVEILQHVIDYILDLQLALETHPALLRQPPPPAPPHHPAGTCPAAPPRTPLTALNTDPVCGRLSPSQEH